ncbi:MAG: hypothetical protein Fur0046_36210 [Cyanobacteria bacterium J069]
MDIGNPPGKSGSLGDSINWEALLHNASQGRDIYFITDDKDYCSPIDPEAFNEFLLKEWTQKKESQVIYHKQLSSLFKKSFPDIKLASELEKDLLIQEFVDSGNFMQTHRAISKLNRYIDFTSVQLNRIVEASVTNSQIYWIIEDEDVKDFLSRVISGKEIYLDGDNLEKLKKSLKGEETREQGFIYDDVPF